MDDIDNTNKILAKQRRGDSLTEDEKKKLKAYEKKQSLKFKGFNRGAYVRFVLDKGVIEGSVVGHDEDDNYLIEYATGMQCVIKPHTVLRKYLLRESTLLNLERYVIGRGKYERLVNKEGKIEKFYHRDMEQKRLRKEEIILPDTERTRPGNDWGMHVV